MADEAATEQVDNLIDEIGFDGFTPGFFEWYVDGDEVGRYFEEFFWDDVRNDPESFLNEEDKTLTAEGEDLVERLEDELSDFKEDLAFLEDESEREDLEMTIDELTQKLDQVEEEEEYMEWSEETMQEYVNGRVEEVKESPVDHLRDYGMEDQIGDFIDKDDFIEGVISSDGRGNGLSSYDGIENEWAVDGEWYYIYRTN